VVRTVLAAQTSVAEAIVSGAFVGVIKGLERFGCFFESLDGFFIARVSIRMILYGQLTIRAGDLAVRGGSLNSEDFVVIALGHG
jgi:hypothetical protein